MLWQKMTRKHPKKSAKWVKEKYWRTIKGKTRTFATSDDSTMHILRRHTSTPIQRHIKVKGQVSPFDGNLLYWAKRLKDHPLTKTTLGKLLQKQQGKCRWCELLFWREIRLKLIISLQKAKVVVKNSATSVLFIGIVMTKGML